MAISDRNFDFVRRFVAEEAAIVLDAGKEYLVEARLQPLSITEGFKSLNDFDDEVRASRAPSQRHTLIVDALTINETFFFRDVHPFDSLRSYIIPDLIKRNAATRTLNIWSAACSSGQEPYTIAMMLLKEFPELASWDVKITAADLSDRILTHARAGRYTQFEVNRGMPAMYLIKYFTKQDSAWYIKDEVKKLVHYSHLNLQSSWMRIPRCDVVFMRNVLIYFNVDTKRRLIDRMKDILKPEAVLFLGGGETTVGIHPDFKAITFGSATAYQVTS